MTQATLSEIVTEEPKPAPADTGMALMIERLAANPDVDVAKLERILAMQKDVMQLNAKAAFDAAFSEMQGEIPLITERGEILVNGQLRSRYARFEDILEVVRPILQRYGFSIRHRNQFSESGKIKIVGILSHSGGHREEDEFEAKADTSGSKNDIQALGSTRSYGQRYTTMSLLGIATKGADDDGHAAAQAGKPDAAVPKGYEDWLLDIEASASDGWAAFQSAWKESKPQFRAYMTQHERAKGEALKARAIKADTAKANGGAK